MRRAPRAFIVPVVLAAIGLAAAVASQPTGSSPPLPPSHPQPK
jgi:hypothetical protein